MKPISQGPRVIVALDVPSSRQALDLAAKLDPELCRLKVGKELFTRAGPELVRQLIGLNFDVFLDLKFHDIPNTVARACAAAAELGVWMINVHTLGGAKMLVAARESLEAAGAGSPLLVGVTILTSLGDADLPAVGLSGNAAANVARLAGLAHETGMDGIVCSAKETRRLRTDLGAGFLLVTPGIRLQGDNVGDQQRVATPATAMADGSDYLVVGRPVIQADNPASVLLTINSEIAVLTN
ncbi:MAG: orotidine-5'-phosphate decarboxylase [Gammaproteobacteria bacterium]